jgi:hypothetical protein
MCCNIWIESYHCGDPGSAPNHWMRQSHACLIWACFVTIFAIISVRLIATAIVLASITICSLTLLLKIRYLSSWNSLPMVGILGLVHLAFLRSNLALSLSISQLLSLDLYGPPASQDCSSVFRVSSVLVGRISYNSPSCSANNIWICFKL